MKALITAGGSGTRLRPITYTSNKHLIPIANKPMIFYALEEVSSVGIREVGIIINEAERELQGVLGKGERWGLKLTYIPQVGGPLGLAHCVKIAENFIGKDSFVFYLGDNILVGGIGGFLEEFERNKPNCQLLLAEVPDPERFGVAYLRGGKVVKTVEKPKNPPTNYIITGVYIMDHHAFEAFHGREAIKPSARGELEIPDVFQYLLEHGYTVTAHRVGGWWKDTGKMEDLLEANRLVLDSFKDGKIKGNVDKVSKILGDVEIGKGSEVIRSEIRGPVVIGEDVTIEDSYIGPYTSIYHNCVIHNSEVEHSILFEGAQLWDLPQRVDRSLLGKGARIVRTDSKPRSLNFLVGDQSHIDLT